LKACSHFSINTFEGRKVKGALRQDEPEYPEIVIREAVVNALVHRSYGNSAHIFFQMYRDCIIVRSPGLPVEPLTIEMFPDQVISVPRNPIIARAAFEMGLMEARGYGIRNMPERLRQHGLEDPRFVADKGYFIIEFSGRESTRFAIRAGRQLLSILTSRQLAIVEMAEKNRTIRSEDVVRTMNISKETASKDLKRLLELKILGRTGSARSTSYFVAQD